MKKYFITGTSSGIGKALAEEALAAGYRVTGLARRNRIEHPNYRHLTVDLTDLDHYAAIGFEGISDKTEEVILINNAGTIAPVKPVASMDPIQIARAYRLNLTAPTILSQLFLENLRDYHGRKTIINISSGAASYPIKSWSVYCASKAALNMFSHVLSLDHHDVRCHAISPGVVDTEMQGEIRASSQRDFPDVQRFMDYKEKGELASAKDVAAKIIHVINNPERYTAVDVSLREVDIPKS